ncbi:MAG: DUF1934 domain-containing protein [Lachnospiraceae bacterium]|nr:DUF1934 domain-containing protein [Lachnospiraceae bacterium]
MTKEVSIKIKGKQCYPQGECAETVTEVTGEYHLRNGSHYVMYEEREAGFAEGTKCMLKIRGDIIELTRKGLLQSRMVFEKDKLHMTDYSTPYGSMMLGVYTKNIQVAEAENEFFIQITYELTAQDSHMADSEIAIKIIGK